MKSEPAAFGIADLQKRKTSFWDGVRNYQVRNMFRDEFGVGDRALFYHSSCGEIGVAGEMEVVSEAEVDLTQFDAESEYFDQKSKTDAPPWLGVKVRFVAAFPTVVTLAQLRTNPKLSGMAILQRGNRLSVVPLKKAEFEEVLKMAGQ